MAIEPIPWYSDLVNYLVTGELPADWSKEARKKLKTSSRFYFWDDPYLFKYCTDQIIRRCVPNTEHKSILAQCHDGPCGGHFSGNKTARKILECGFYWPTLFKDAHNHSKTCYRCQLLGKPAIRNEMPQHYIWVE